jgi:hypothetical protein
MDVEARTLQIEADTEIDKYRTTMFNNPVVNRDTKITQMNKILNLKERESVLWKNLSLSNAPSEVKNNAKRMESAATVYAKAWKKYIDDYKTNEKEGKDESEPPALELDGIKPEVLGGGQQRTTRKHKSSIIGSARKTRTNR